MSTASAAEPLEALDERLVQVALELLASEGLEKLSLRRIARRAGVSHGAPLRHFRSLAELNATVAARGFEMLSEAVEKGGSLLPPDAGALARLAAAGRAYVDVAVRNPGLFALMFRPEDLDTGNPLFVRSSGAAFQQLLRHVRAAQDAGWHPGRDARLLAGVVWAAVHGVAMLWSQGALLGPIPGASLEDVLDSTLEMVLEDPQGDTP